MWCSSVLAVLNFIIFVNSQTVTIAGKLECNGEAASGVMVKINDDGNKRNSQLGSDETSTDGIFSVTGSISTLDPEVNIYHDCNQEGTCSKITVPHGFRTRKYYDIGTVNLSNEEMQDCGN